MELEATDEWGELRTGEALEDLEVEVLRMEPVREWRLLTLAGLVVVERPELVRAVLRLDDELALPGFCLARVAEPLRDFRCSSVVAVVVLVSTELIEARLDCNPSSLGLRVGVLLNCGDARCCCCWWLLRFMLIERRLWPCCCFFSFCARTVSIAACFKSSSLVSSNICAAFITKCRTIADAFPMFCIDSNGLECSDPFRNRLGANTIATLCANMLFASACSTTRSKCLINLSSKILLGKGSSLT